MKPNKSLISLLLLATLTTCTKFGKNVYVDGRVYNPFTGEGIPNVHLKLYRGQFDWGDPISSPTSKNLKAVVTDADGYYKMEYLSTPFNKVYVSINSGNNYLMSQYYYTVKKGKKNQVDFEAVPYGNYQLIMNNINCQGTNDSIIIKQTNQAGTFSGVDQIKTGCVAYTSGFQKIPMGKVRTRYTVIRNGIATAYDVNFEVLSDQNNIQTINY